MYLVIQHLNLPAPQIFWFSLLLQQLSALLHLKSENLCEDLIVNVQQALLVTNLSYFCSSSALSVYISCPHTVASFCAFSQEFL